MERIHGEPCMVLPELPEAFLASHQPRTCVINWPRVHKKWKCPVEGCPYKASTNANFHNHFMYRHPYDSIHVTNESLEPWDKCELCGLQHPAPTWRCHTESATCIRGRITKRSRDIANKILQADEQVFTIDGTPIESVGSFRYLGRAESRTDSDWGPCLPTSGGPATNGTSFPSFSLEKVLIPVSLACFTRLWCRLCYYLVLNLGL